jgi:hypothetical protein
MLQNPWHSIVHYIAQQAIMKLKPTADQLAVFRNTMINPKPIKTITLMSWNIGYAV